MHQWLILLVTPGLCFARPQVGFGDASDQEIAEIRSGSYLEDFDDNPQYNYNYKVADEDEQTYIAMEENRAGETVTGSYSYVDPLGSLITVTYSAGINGYTETRDVQENYVTIRARPVRTRPVNTVNAVATAEAQRLEAQRLEARRQEAQRVKAQRLEAQRLESQRIETQRLEAQRLETQRVEAQRLEAQRLEAQRIEAQRLEAARLEAEAAANSQADIITQIVAQIQPLVSQTVTSAVSGQTVSSSPSRLPSLPSPGIAFPSRAPIPPVSAPRSIARVRVPVSSGRNSGDVTAVFGQGGNYNVRFNTPDFNIEY